MSRRFWPAIALALLAWSYFARPVYDFGWIALGRVVDAVSAKLGPPLLRQERQAVIDRTVDQGREIEAYLRPRSAPAATGTGSADDLRERLRQSLRYPPFDMGASGNEAVEETPLGQDDLATYWQLRIPVAPGIHSVGFYLRPRSADRQRKLPLVIAAHGRIGTPAPTADGTLHIVQPNNRDMAWHALQRGYAVWQPLYVHYGEQGDDFRDRLTVRAWQAGTSLPAIEIAKTVKALDVLLQRPDIDAGRVAMVGLSYGGFYTLYTTALEPRIRVAVVAAYLNDRAAVLEVSEPYGFLDWRFQDSLSMWRDPAVAALVAPRPLLIEAGNQDQLFPIEGARRAAGETAQVYTRLGAAERFKFLEFVGRHDFHGKAAMDFVDEHLQHGAPVAGAIDAGS